MINIYPANRLENLVILLDRVMQTGSHTNILSEEIILVQSKGMQHWLNMKLAESRGISMNLAFSLPMQFFWQQIRHILGKERVPEQSSYDREVLSWRIDEILARDEITGHPLCQEPSYYWRPLKNGIPYEQKDKRFQLACQLADLFEQYQIFRPDWLLDWEKGRVEHWQAVIWQKLVAQQPLHPIRLLKEAVSKLSEQTLHLPDRINLFGINTLPSLWLDFLSELGKYTQVHFFHLNPCVEYWGDLKTERAYAREQFYRWLNISDMVKSDVPKAIAHKAEVLEVSNPLLANLGGQGKEFLYLLQEHCSLEIPVYESPVDMDSKTGKQTTATVLARIQNDILRLQDARQQPEVLIDDSLFIASAHSALREIQALHDWLLEQFNKDNSLTPKDILVMCPNVENYAPYVEAVFAHGWSDCSEQTPPLPCSIADRTLKDSEPLVQAFIDLLELPDNRFQVSQIFAYLRLPAVKKKFAFDENDLLVMERWINHAAIHWGIDEQHKQQVLDNENSNNKFSWQQGLQRLLLGFAQGDQAEIYQQQLLLPDVEGDEALILGRCMQLLEQLQFYARELQTERHPEQWQHFLQQAKENLFGVLVEDFNAQQIIEQAIDDLGEFTTYAQYDQKIPLAVVRDFLLSHFSQPEPGRQFMAGQVTFCSMVPMRSVPFRIIAVLGLNDGEFPRQRQPMGFDLMAMEMPRKGDRSRRGDDRYLFLEALISCRDKLYLSYQGHDIKNNNPRQPSLVLHELMDYLQKGYGWQLTDGSAEQLYQVPLQAFSQANFQESCSLHQIRSFNSQWLKLADPGYSRNNLQQLPELQFTEDRIELSAEELVRFFDNPCRSFAQIRLKLFFDSAEEIVAQDCEPFVTDYLLRYLVQDELIKAKIQDESVDPIMQRIRLSGQLPDNPEAEQQLLDWQDKAGQFAEQVQRLLQSDEQTKIDFKTVRVSIDQFDIEAQLPLLNNKLLFWRPAEPKAKDDIRLWLYHLIAQLYFSDNAEEATDKELAVETLGIFNSGKDSFLKVSLSPVQSPGEYLSQLLSYWQQGMRQPLLFNASLGKAHCQDRQNGPGLSEAGFNALWSDDYNKKGLAYDPYINWFWSDTPPLWQGELIQSIESIYDNLYMHRQQEKIE